MTSGAGEAMTGDGVGGPTWDFEPSAKHIELVWSVEAGAGCFL